MEITVLNNLIFFYLFADIWFVQPARCVPVHGVI